KALYRAAGSPEYRRLVEQAAGRRPPVRLSVQSISDWLRGKSVPASWLVVRFLIVHLSELAAQRGTPVPVLDWARLHEQARRARSRDGTAVSRGTVPGPSRFGPLPRPAWRWQLRSRETDVLRLALSAPGSVVALVGARGSGKSQLAAAHARSRVEHGDELVAWIDSAAGTEQQLAQL